MDFVKKDKIKDNLILSLIDTLLDVYSYNNSIINVSERQQYQRSNLSAYNLDKNIIKNKIIAKLIKFNILDKDITNENENEIDLKNNIYNLISDELSTQIISNNSFDVKKEILDIISDEITLLNNSSIEVSEELDSSHSGISKELQGLRPYWYGSAYKNTSITCEFLGSGGFSNVYKVYNNLDDKFYAVKKIGINQIFYKSLFEVRSMAKLDHKNIIRYHTSWLESKFNNNLDIKQILDNSSDNLELVKYENGSFETDHSEYDEKNYDKFIFIQMELCKNNLTTYLLDNKPTFEEKKNICLQIVNGIKYIHENEVLHRDLKPGNIFISCNNDIKIGDFGLAVNVYNLNYSEEVGTIGYMAPEILKGEIYSYEADLYSLGVIILEVFCNFKTKMEKILTIKQIRENKKVNIEDKNIKILILGLIKDNPKDRITIENIIKLLN